MFAIYYAALDTETRQWVKYAEFEKREDAEKMVEKAKIRCRVYDLGIDYEIREVQ